MAVRPLLTNLIRAKLQLESKRNLWRPVCHYHIVSRPIEGDEVRPKKELENDILRLKYPSDCVTTLVQRWADNGVRVSFDELRGFCFKLIKFKRYSHSLQIMDWLESQSGFEMTPTDYEVKTELLVDVKGLIKAREYFDKLTGSASRKAACFPLLHGYIRARETEKAEGFMARLTGSGLVLTPHPYNEMMKLYMATSQFRKVGLVVEEMKRNRIALNVLSYNIWMNSCWELYGIESVEMVYKEMMRDSRIRIGWSSLVTLANAYAKAGQNERADLALSYAEKKLSSSDHLGYSFLITQHTFLKNKEEVVRLWEKNKAVGGRITCASYMSVILCMVKLGNLVEAERLFGEWEASRGNYDIRVSNVLLGAYARSGLMDKAEALHRRTLDLGAKPNYKTYEILVEGWVRSREMEKAIEAMKIAFSMMRHCHWRPSNDIVMVIAEYYEKLGDVEGANWFVKSVSDSGFGSLALYKSLLRIHRHARRPAPGVAEMMMKDKIEMDEEATRLFKVSMIFGNLPCSEAQIIS